MRESGKQETPVAAASPEEDVLNAENEDNSKYPP
jgi:hypothetical protein